jgi:hypothetical protein
MSKKSSILVAAVVTVFSFFMITWLSCNKPSQPYSCDGIVCINGGHCYQDTLPPHKPHCACPSGFEGTNCSTPSVNKFLGPTLLSLLITFSITRTIAISCVI